VRDSGCGRFIDQPAVDESLQLERLGKRMALARGQHMRKRPAAHRNCLEAAGSPAAIDVKTRTGVGPMMGLESCTTSTMPAH